MDIVCTQPSTGQPEFKKLFELQRKNLEALKNSTLKSLPGSMYTFFSVRNLAQGLVPKVS